MAAFLTPLLQGHSRCFNFVATLILKHKLSRTKFEGHESNRCFANAQKILKDAKASKAFNVGSSYVLYISHYQIWETHVAIQSENYFIDVQRGHSELKATLSKAKDFFNPKNISPKSKVLLIPAEEYLRDFPQHGEDPYVDALKGRPTNDTIKSYTIMNLSDYLETTGVLRD